LRHVSPAATVARAVGPFLNPPATTAIYTLSLHDALPIYPVWTDGGRRLHHLPERISRKLRRMGAHLAGDHPAAGDPVSAPRYRRSEEHTSELQSRENLVCRLLLEKKMKRDSS